MIRTKYPYDTTRRVIDWHALEELCSLQCTETEIAAVVGMERPNLEKKVREKYGISFAEYWKQKSAPGRVSLRRMQFKLALGDEKHPPNVIMLIWLGKQMLGQSDKGAIEHTYSG